MRVYPILADSEEQGTVVVARTSRSPLPFSAILEEVREKGHVPFIKTNVLGYGHDSVAEGAMTPWIAVEDVSDLAGNILATADPLLKVQMTSTRYQDMARRGVYTPPYMTVIDATADEDYLSCDRGLTMRNEYAAASVVVQNILDKKDHPRKRTLQCDIARSRLPAGIMTQLAVRGDARCMRDTVSFLLGSYLDEVREIGEQIRLATKPFVETLFDRHISPREDTYRTAGPFAVRSPGAAKVMQVAIDDKRRLINILTDWKHTGWRARVRPASVPMAFMSVALNSDYGAYRDLRRNRTIHQEDILPRSIATPTDALWAFRDLYPDVCDEIDTTAPKALQFSPYASPESWGDPYIAPMGSMMEWRAAGHFLNWAYMFRLRSSAVCHPGYAIPVRNAMRSLAEFSPEIAKAMGIVYSKGSLCGIEFEDRVPEGSHVQSV